MSDDQNIFKDAQTSYQTGGIEALSAYTAKLVNSHPEIAMLAPLHVARTLLKDDAAARQAVNDLTIGAVVAAPRESWNRKVETLTEILGDTSLNTEGRSRANGMIKSVVLDAADRDIAAGRAPAKPITFMAQMAGMKGLLPDDLHRTIDDTLTVLLEKPRAGEVAGEEIRTVAYLKKGRPLFPVDLPEIIKPSVAHYNMGDEPMLARFLEEPARQYAKPLTETDPAQAMDIPLRIATGVEGERKRPLQRLAWRLASGAPDEYRMDRIDVFQAVLEDEAFGGDKRKEFVAELKTNLVTLVDQAVQRGQTPNAGIETLARLEAKSEPADVRAMAATTLHDLITTEPLALEAFDRHLQKSINKPPRP